MISSLQHETITKLEKALALAERKALMECSAADTVIEAMREAHALNKCADEQEGKD